MVLSQNFSRGYTRRKSLCFALDLNLDGGVHAFEFTMMRLDGSFNPLITMNSLSLLWSVGGAVVVRFLTMMVGAWGFEPQTLTASR